MALNGGRPHFRATDVVQAGCRTDDEHLPEVRDLLPEVLTANDVRDSIPHAARRPLDVVDRPDLDGYWLHLDVDILAPEIMPAVDSPAPGGLTGAELAELLDLLAPRQRRRGHRFAPDLDPSGRYAATLTHILASGLARLGSDHRR